MFRLRPGVMVAGLAVLVAACGSPPGISGSGPLSAGGEPGQLCVPVQVGQTATIGMDVVRNQGTKTIQVQSVELAGSHDLKLVDARFLSLETGEPVGVWAQYPPEPADASGQAARVRWQSSRPASGASIPAGAAATNLIVGVKPLAQSGSADGLRLKYTSDGTEFEALTSTEITVQNGSTCQR